MLILDEKEFPALPVTPSEPPAANKKTTKSVKTASDSDIIGTLSRLINERSDSIEKLVNGNTERIDEIDIAFADIKEIQSKICKVKGRVLELEKPVKMLEQRMDEFDSYSRR